MEYANQALAYAHLSSLVNYASSSNVLKTAHLMEYAKIPNVYAIRIGQVQIALKEDVQMIVLIMEYATQLVSNAFAKKVIQDQIVQQKNALITVEVNRKDIAIKESASVRMALLALAAILKPVLIHALITGNALKENVNVIQASKVVIAQFKYAQMTALTMVYAVVHLNTNVLAIKDLLEMIVVYQDARMIARVKEFALK